MHFDTQPLTDFNVVSNLPNEEILSIVSQPFTYLNRGAQSYVFTSKDGKCVIKFFRHHNSFSSTQKHKDLSKQKMQRLFSASILAYEKAQKETGVLFLHHNPTKDNLPYLHVKGPVGQKFSLDLNSYRFIIQKKVDPFQESLLKAYHSSDKLQMARHIDSFITLLHSRVLKGIQNTDPSLIRNFGFFNEEAFEIDFGNYIEHAGPSNQDFIIFSKKFRKWLRKNAPEWVSYFDEHLKIKTHQNL